ncbi:hypothetical protein [Tabrizicola sp.]|uniref:hypothetical protein n=1 Tax=Tabrizicola sp. TaxID=2005166 RepID=UPI00273243F0|nr:hypothetical protein [Tabrizicola sp.]MDP3195907.1 hypothetical protein [Tabrizicola sp.]MDZ4069246.1 hypothetical protein [Tabrizicola sp.]
MRQFLAACLVTVSLPAWAEGPSPVKIAEVSARLYAAGMDAGDPILVLSAAKLRKGLGLVPGDRVAVDGVAGQGAPLGWEEMLAQATALAAGDEVVLGLIEDASVEMSKGVASGPVYNIGSLGNGKGDTYPPIEFRGGEYAEVYVEAKAATNLNLAIYDDRGRLVCSDTDISHIAYCGWTPASAGSFTLKVENKGPAAADYALMTN